MKTWPLTISILVILVVVGSPVLAISKSDLISSYKGQSIPTPMPTPTPTPQIPSDVIEPLHGVGSLSVISDPSGANVYIDGTLKGTTPLTITGLPIISYRPPGGNSFTITVTMMGFKENITQVYLFIGEHRTVSVTLTPTQTTPSWYTGKDIPTPKPILTPPRTLSPFSANSEGTGNPRFRSIGQMGEGLSHQLTWLEENFPTSPITPHSF
jgi:hypothetical protein